MDPNMYELIYDYDNVRYKVFQTDELHSKLHSDNSFAASWFEENKETLEILAIIGNDASEEVGVSNCSDKFQWDHASTMLLLDSYLVRKEEFRTPSIKKQNLWSEISEVFSKSGYNVKPEQLDAKFRNLKKTFVMITDNNSRKRTGRDGVSWQYFNIFEEIFADCRSVILEKQLITGSALKRQFSSIAYPSTSTSNETSPLAEEDCEEPVPPPPKKSNKEKLNYRRQKLEKQRNVQQNLEKEKVECLRQFTKEVQETRRQVVAELRERNSILREFVQEYKKNNSRL